MKKTDSKSRVPKATKPKGPRIQLTKEALLDVRHEFTDTEKVELGLKLTSAMTTRANVLEQKKSMAKEYDSKVKIFDIEIGGIHTRIHDGCEFRPTKCVVHFNKATRDGKVVTMPGTKRIVRADTGAHVRDEPMSPGDLQDELFEIEQAKKAEQPKKESAGLNSPEVPAPGETTSTAATS